MFSKPLAVLENKYPKFVFENVSNKKGQANLKLSNLSKIVRSE